jgi:hypothetical protein
MMNVSTALFVTLAILGTAEATSAAPAATQPTTSPAGAHEVVKTDEFAMAVPSGWRDFRGAPRQFKMFRQGDGKGVPLVDETGAPLQIGLTVEKFRDPKSIEEGAAELTKAAKANAQLEIVGEPKLEKLKLADGTEALLLSTEFIKEGRRHSLQMKLLAKRGTDDAYVASGFLVGGKESTWPTTQSKLAKWLRAYMTTFVLDPAKLDTTNAPGAFEPEPATP